MLCTLSGAAWCSVCGGGVAALAQYIGPIPPQADFVGWSPLSWAACRVPLGSEGCATVCCVRCRALRGVVCVVAG